MNASNDESNNPSQNNPAAETEQRKKGKGRQKITMAKIENETNLQVTFSKRRAGVFKKASELSTLCGAESAVVVFSPGNKPHSFGHPNVETVANRLFHPAAATDAPARTNQLIMAHSEVAMQQRNQELVSIEAELERERQRKKELDSMSSGGHLAPPQLEGMSYDELDQLRRSVLGFKREFEAKVKNGGNSSSWNAGAGAGVGPVAAADSTGFPQGYGYGGIHNPNPNPNPNPSAAYGLASGASYGQYMVQYPHQGVHGAFSYSGPSAVVPYDPRMGSSDANADGGRERPADDRNNNFRGFGTNYRRPEF